MPMAALLRQQAALQSVRELGHNTREVCHLLVEIFAQALKLFRVAQLLRFDDLIKFFTEDFIESKLRQLIKWPVWPPRDRALVRAFAGVFLYVINILKRSL